MYPICYPSITKIPVKTDMTTIRKDNYYAYNMGLKTMCQGSLLTYIFHPEINYDKG